MNTDALKSFLVKLDEMRAEKLKDISYQLQSIMSFEELLRKHNYLLGGHNKCLVEIDSTIELIKKEIDKSATVEIKIDPKAMSAEIRKRKRNY